PLLVRCILENICNRQHVHIPDIDPSAMSILMAHRWPGNIRELENVLERALAYSEEGQIAAKHLVFGNPVLDRRSANQIPAHPVLDRRVTPQPDPPLETTNTPSIPEDKLPKPYVLVGKTLHEIERDAIIQTLEHLGGNKAKAARTLGVCEKTIYNKMKKLKIDI
ncbi:MAG: helix-turn-helix domain-containing protein, partial [Planctomycetota bacterium]